MGDEDITPPTETTESSPEATPTEGVPTDLPAGETPPQPTADTTGTPSNSVDLNAPLPAITDLGTTPDATANGLPAVDTLPDATTPTPQTNPESGEVVLPETITNVNPLDVAAPVTGDVPIDATIPAGDVPVDVAPPGEATAPSLGNLPSDSSLDIAAPESLEASVPPIDNVPLPLEVAPPEGWVPDSGDDSGIGVVGDVFGDGNATCNYHRTCTPEDLEDLEKKYEEEQAKILEDAILSEAENLANLVDALNNQDIKDKINPDEVEAIIQGILQYAAYEPGDTLKLLTYLNILIDSKQMDAQAVKDFGYFAKRDLDNGNINDLKNLIGIELGAAIAPGKDPMIGFLSGVMNFGPGIGDGKGVIEAWTGRDLLTGDSISGFARWAGLAGLVGLAELKYGDDIARFIRNGGRLGRMGTATARTIDEGMAARIIGCATRSFNSFSPDTLVHTDKGLLTIGALATLGAGSMALAYNEATGENEYQPILQVFENQDPEVTFLTLQDTESSQDEMIVTTPGHPFYLEVNVDASSRPAPQGHEDLAEPWVGAGDLKVGDKVRQADGTTGTVRIVNTEQKVQTMYNLDVANLDNFYVGEQGWLVHNQDGSNIVYRVIRPDEDPLLGLLPKNPLAEYSVDFHVRNGSRVDTQFISVTRSLDVAMKWADKTGARIVSIDLSKLSGSEIIDLSTEAGRATYLKNPLAINFAKASQELLIKGNISATAITSWCP